jgi:MtN3 and saliva related transmembrane protein
MSNLEIFGYIAGALTTFSAYPQLRYSYKTKDVRSLNVTFMSMLITGLSLWAVYGFFIESTPVIVFNAIGALLWAPIFFWKIKSIKQKNQN